MRVAPTFLRFGSFELFTSTDHTTGLQGPCVGMESFMLPKMLKYTMDTFYPGLDHAGFFDQVI